VTFRYGDFDFGVRVEDVAGMIEADQLAPLPGQVDSLAGVVAFRGEMVPVLHLAAFLELDAPAGAGGGYAVVLARGAERFGILVPDLPKLVSANDLRAGEVTAEADNELDGLIECVYRAGERPLHCLNYARIYDSIVPPATSRADARAASTMKETRHG
jgi:chemotaxis signal transduction protein